LELDEDFDPATEAEETMLLYRRAVELMQNEFQERTWQAFWRVVVDGKAPGQVASELGTTANAVYLAKARVLSRLRKEFEDLIDSRRPK
jgi:RNA polymerase sigma-70 factor (ECF subfamily)